MLCWNARTLIVLGLILICAGCSENQEVNSKSSEAANSMDTDSPKSESPNKAVLDEADAAGDWFHAKKTRPIWARRLEAAQSVKTLEGEEQVEAGHYLCRGEAGDIWPQSEEGLNKRYTATEEVDADGWRKYEPNPDADGVMATQVDHPFSVEATWGTLTAKAGDFLVKNYTDRETPYPVDVWIVDQTLFQQTYETVPSKDEQPVIGFDDKIIFNLIPDATQAQP